MTIVHLVAVHVRGLLMIIGVSSGRDSAPSDYIDMQPYSLSWISMKSEDHHTKEDCSLCSIAICKYI